MYEDEPIIAAFHSMSSGKTESAENMWGTAVDYLVPVNSKSDKDAPDYADECEISAEFVRARLEKVIEGIQLGDNLENWIKTGDVGYLTEEGHLKFTSRIKRIIIISGYNIYPATIEKKVLSLDYISEACACQGYDENGKPYVKLVVALNDKEADEEAIKEKLMTYCKENFEGYGCPRKIFVVPELPRTKMEKIDFVKLSDPVPQAK